MDGIHDMGGMTTFGPVPRADTSPFHAEWEKRLAGIGRNVVGRLFPIDEFRYALERLEPGVYLSATYYERWLAGLERLFVEKGLVTEEEMAAALAGWKPQPGVPPADAGDGQPGEPDTTPRYSRGDRVRVRNTHDAGHTRVPRYVQGRGGVVERVLGAQVLPDDLVAGRGPRMRPVYAVCFAARELWGARAEPRDSVLIDVWEDHLRPDGSGEPHVEAE